ncbi:MULTISPECIES: hypothetical protein [unclassified Acidocella]|uniref:hypothetical protein n=1 Tax=unclassified Acidocella TaxID=2648610 RepID=UPI0003467984|nr:MULTISPECIES: hypothetical protein [unclassified Acidocella]WBO60544.1 hypothetical protein GT370_07175 [Acidocella sp. MX-AZ03]
MANKIFNADLSDPSNVLGLGAAAKLPAGGAGGAAVLDENGNASALNIVPYLGTLSRPAGQAIYRARINVAQFGAAGSAAATTGSIASGSDVLMLSSPIDFQPGQYVRVDGAGTDGDGTRLIAEIVSGAGTNLLTLSKAASASVSGANVTHDDTAAIQAAINYAVSIGGAEIMLDAGVYLVGGAPQNANVTNAILTLPLVAFGSDVTVKFSGPVGVGFFREVLSAAPAKNGAVLVFPYICPNASTNGSVIQGVGYGQFYANSNTANITAINLIMQDLAFEVPSLSGYIVIGGQGVQNTIYDRISVYTPTISDLSPLPTNANETAISLGGNSCMSVARQCYAQGLYNGITPGVHSILDGNYVQNCVIAYSIFCGDHVQHWPKNLAQNCRYIIGRNANDPGPNPSATVMGWLDTEITVASSDAFQYQGFAYNLGTGAGQLDLNGRIYYTLDAPAGGAPYNTGISVFDPAGGSCQYIHIGGGGENIEQTAAGSSPDSFSINSPAQILIEGAGLTAVTITRNGTTVNVPVVNTLAGVPTANINVVKSDTLTITWSGTAPVISAIPLQ